jgi:hypothetical protein
MSAVMGTSSFSSRQPASLPLIMHAVRSVLTMCSVSVGLGLTVAITAMRASSLTKHSISTRVSWLDLHSINTTTITNILQCPHR